MGDELVAVFYNSTYDGNDETFIGIFSTEEVALQYINSRNNPKEYSTEVITVDAIRSGYYDFVTDY